MVCLKGQGSHTLKDEQRAYFAGATEYLFDGLVQACSNSFANALELLISQFISSFLTKHFIIPYK